MAEGINGYSKPSPSGKGMIVDIETMMVDLVMVLKAGAGISREQFLEFAGEIFDNTTVEISIPQRQKN